MHPSCNSCTPTVPVDTATEADTTDGGAGPAYATAEGVPPPSAHPLPTHPACAAEQLNNSAMPREDGPSPDLPDVAYLPRALLTTGGGQGASDRAGKGGSVDGEGCGSDDGGGGGGGDGGGFAGGGEADDDGVHASNGNREAALSPALRPPLCQVIPTLAGSTSTTPSDIRSGDPDARTGRDAGLCAGAEGKGGGEPTHSATTGPHDPIDDVAPTVPVLSASPDEAPATRPFGEAKVAQEAPPPALAAVDEVRTIVHTEEICPASGPVEASSPEIMPAACVDSNAERISCTELHPSEGAADSGAGGASPELPPSRATAGFARKLIEPSSPSRPILPPQSARPNTVVADAASISGNPDDAGIGTDAGSRPGLSDQLVSSGKAASQPCANAGTSGPLATGAASSGAGGCVALSCPNPLLLGSNAGLDDALARASQPYNLQRHHATASAVTDNLTRHPSIMAPPARPDVAVAAGPPPPPPPRPPRRLPAWMRPRGGRGAGRGKVVREVAANASALKKQQQREPAEGNGPVLRVYFPRTFAPAHADGGNGAKEGIPNLL